jgi:hypothetical protein
MRAAPPVSVRCNGGAAWRLVQTGLFALAAAVLAAWTLAQLGLATAWAAAPGLAVAALAWRGCRSREVALTWDGRAWTADGIPGRLEVMIDLGTWLLLRMRLDGGTAPRWIAVSAGEAGLALHGLRAAVHARAAGTAPGRRPAKKVAD